MSKKLMSRLLYIGLILTPIFGFQELLKAITVFSGSVNTEAEIPIKATKDLILVVIWGYCPYYSNSIYDCIGTRRRV
jgi:hypothetical protein